VSPAASDRAVRSVTLAVASVSCSNGACMALHRHDPSIAPILHQHGCSQTSDDVALTREILAGLMANPNVARSVVIGLGCEANQPDALAARASEKGADVRVVGIQSSGGVGQAVEAAAHELAGDPSRGAPPRRAVRVGVIADASIGASGSNLVRRLSERLLADGRIVVVSAFAADQPPARVVATPTAVPDAWRPSTGDTSQALDALREPTETLTTVRAGTTDVERLTGVTACGAEVTVVLTATASLIGSPIAPTIKVSCDDGIDALGDVVDVPYAGGIGLAERTAEMVADVITGRRTNAERNGARDVAIWRIAPYF